MVAAAGAGPDPIPQKEFTTSSLMEAIRYCLSRKAVDAAVQISHKMVSETGVQTAADSFHRNLPLSKLGCDIYPHLPATWQHSKKKGYMKISSLAAETLGSNGTMDMKQLKM